MKHLSTLWKTLLITLLPVITSTLSAQDAVTLLLRMDTASFTVAKVSADDPILDSAADMPYEMDAVKIWKWVELNQTFDGFVRRNYITKGTGLQPGAPVYFIAGDEDAFLTIYEEAFDAEIIEAVDETWAKITINTSIPVYFETNAPVAEPIIAEVVTAPVVEENYEAESNFASDLPEEPTDLGIDATPSSGPIDRILEGKLVSYKPAIPNPFRKSPYQWQIINKQKQRLAFVDPEKLILSIPFRNYEGKRVSINGSIYQVNKGKDILIVAHQISKI